MKSIDQFLAAGNTLKNINYYMSSINVDLCRNLQNEYALSPFFTTIQDFSASFNDLTKIVKSLSANWVNTSSLTYNLSGYWLEPITIVYENTFNLAANINEIETWLDTNFASTFATGQILKVSSGVKNYSSDSLNNTFLPSSISTDYLNGLANAYNQKLSDINRYLSFKNHITSYISILNNIFKQLGKKAYLIDNEAQLSTYYNSFSVFENTLTSTLLLDIEQDKLSLIYSYLAQYILIKDDYDHLIELGINTIPANILTAINTQNIFITYFMDFCFLQTNGKWKYIPDCRIKFCANQYCYDCYEYIDPNSVYDRSGCPLNSKYQLTTCEGDVYLLGNSLFETYKNQYIDIIIDNVEVKALVEDIKPNVNYPNSFVLLSNRYSVNGISSYQNCGVPPTTTLAPTTTTLEPAPTTGIPTTTTEFPPPPTTFIPPPPITTTTTTSTTPPPVTTLPPTTTTTLPPYTCELAGYYSSDSGGCSPEFVTIPAGYQNEGESLLCWICTTTTTPAPTTTPPPATTTAAPTTAPPGDSYLLSSDDNGNASGSYLDKNGNPIPFSYSGYDPFTTVDSVCCQYGTTPSMSTGSYSYQGDC